MAGQTALERFGITLCAAMSREILQRLDQNGIGIAPATYKIAGLPALALERKDKQR